MHSKHRSGWMACDPLVHSGSCDSWCKEFFSSKKKYRVTHIERALVFQALTLIGKCAAHV